MGKKLNYNFIPVDRPGHDLCYSVDPQKFYAKGWTEPVSYQQRLEQTVNWYLNNQEWLYV
jgi:dTDP-D-glucose 4,6-dehydratase